MANKGISNATLGAASVLARPSDSQVTTAVNAWLEDNPEATTTVQDGAISYAKLNSSLQGTVDDVGTLKELF